MGGASTPRCIGPPTSGRSFWLLGGRYPVVAGAREALPAANPALGGVQTRLMEAASPVQPDDLLFATQPPNTDNFPRSHKKTSLTSLELSLSVRPRHWIFVKLSRTRTKRSLFGRATRSSHLPRPVCEPCAGAAGPRAPPVYLGREGGGLKYGTEIIGKQLSFVFIRSGPGVVRMTKWGWDRM
ncbi:hypothetical protein AAG570_000844 [Ranatra chinensis]|uniref:Uncharacterized protein n=1 Tax=Ranatra chinensis TaxID=642074 RepID=A0ABD0YYX1_9HEMI